MKTVSAKKEDVTRQWFVLDAEDQVLGRVATRVASVLRGKHKPIYTPHTDTGDFVVVVNAKKVRLTGKKESDKMYYHHTGWVGGIMEETAGEMRERKAEDLLYTAIKGMLPRGPLGRQMFKKLKVYSGSEHPHSAQKPQPLAVER